MHTLKQQFANGERLNFFALSRLISPVSIEMYALRGGFAGFWLDLEHGMATVDQIRATFITARAVGLQQFVRMAPTGYQDVAQYLELGAGGVMAAQIHSVEQASTFGEWAKFPPQGLRGMNMSGVDGQFTTRTATDFYESANDEVFVAIQIETSGALEDVEAIAALDNVDHLFVGPSDLSIALGNYPDFHADVLWDAVERVSKACRKHGKSWGAVTPDPRWADRAVALGCQLVSMSNETIALKLGVDAVKTKFADRFLS
ncbi:MAG: aldolase/citrate lyase family protein [Planctomycetaceae bacterium]